MWLSWIDCPVRNRTSQNPSSDSGYVLISFSFSHSWLVSSLISSVKACDWSADVRKSCSHWFCGFGAAYIQLVSFEGFIYYYYYFIWSFTCLSFLIPPSDRSLIPLTSWPIVSLDAPVLFLDSSGSSSNLSSSQTFHGCLNISPHLSQVLLNCVVC